MFEERRNLSSPRDHVCMHVCIYLSIYVYKVYETVPSTIWPEVEHARTSWLSFQATHQREGLLWSKASDVVVISVEDAPMLTAARRLPLLRPRHVIRHGLRVILTYVMV
jgi:hypothetical protein